MELSYQVDEYEALVFAQKHSGLTYQEVEDAYVAVGGMQGYSPYISLAPSDSNNIFVAAIQSFMRDKGIDSVNVVQDH